MWHYQDPFYHYPLFEIAIQPPHAQCIDIALSQCDCSSWEAAGSIFHLSPSESPILCLQTHISFPSIIPIPFPPFLIGFSTLSYIFLSFFYLPFLSLRVPIDQISSLFFCFFAFLSFTYLFFLPGLLSKYQSGRI